LIEPVARLFPSRRGPTIVYQSVNTADDPLMTQLAVIRFHLHSVYSIHCGLALRFSSFAISLAPTHQ
jgi:hypothetical protein